MISARILIIAAAYGLTALLIGTDRARPVGVDVAWILALLAAFQLVVEWSLSRGEAPSRRVIRAVGWTVATLLAAVAVDQLLHVTLRPLEANQHPVAWMGVLSSPILDLMGVESESAGGRLLIQGRGGTLEVAMGLDKLALGPIVTMLCILLWRSGSRLSWRLVTTVAGCALFVALGRQVLCCALLAQEPKLLSSASGATLASIYASRWIDGATIGVLLVVLLVATKARPSWLGIPIARVAPVRPLRLKWAAAAAALLGLSWTALHLEATGPRKSGLVVFDDQHNGTWGRSDRRMDERWYGDYSTYNMNSGLEWLGHRYPAAVNRDRPLGPDLLNDTSVLVLKTPSKPFAPEEVAALHSWVDGGGSLLAIGDHTDLHGMNTHLNVVLEPYGIRLNFDAVSDAHSGSFNRYQTSRWYPEPGILANLDRVEFMTGCSISTSGFPRGAMVGSRLARDAGDYTRGSNFGKRRSDPATGVGPGLVAVGQRAGAGKVAVISDQTIFSSYSLFKNGHDDFLLSVIGWLSREAHPGLGLAAKVLGLFALILGVGLLGFTRPLIAVAFTAPIIVASNFALAAYHGKAFEAPPHGQHYHTAEVLWVGGVCAFPPSIGSIGKLDAQHAFDTLLTDIARTGTWPKVVREYDDSLRDSTRMVFVLNPVWEPPSGYLERLAGWVQGGGTLVVVDPGEATWNETSSDTFLSALGLAAKDFEREGRTLWRPAYPADGFVDTPSDMQWVRRPCGSGEVFHAFASEKLSRKGIAHAFTLPSELVRTRVHDLYSMIQGATAAVPGDRHTYALFTDQQSKDQP